MSSKDPRVIWIAVVLAISAGLLVLITLSVSPGSSDEVCSFSVFMILFIMLTIGLFMIWDGKRNGKSFTGFSYIVAIILVVIVIASGAYINKSESWPELSDFTPDSWKPEFEYYISNSNISENGVRFESERLWDYDAIMFKGRMVYVFITLEKKTYELRYIHGSNREEYSIPVTIDTIVNDTYESNERFTADLVVEGEELACYYTYRSQYSAPLVSAWRISTNDGIVWEPPEEVDYEPSRKLDPPSELDNYRDVDAMDPVKLKLSNGDTIISLEYWGRDYDVAIDHGAFFVYKSKGGEWTDPIRIDGYLPIVKMHEITPLQILVAVSDGHGGDHQYIDYFLITPDDFDDLDGPYTVENRL